MNAAKSTFNFRVNAQILDETRLNKYHADRETYEAKGLRITRIGQDYVVVDSTKQVSEGFWHVWNRKRDELKEAGYRVARAFGHYILYKAVKPAPLS